MIKVPELGIIILLSLKAISLTRWLFFCLQFPLPAHRDTALAHGIDSAAILPAAHFSGSCRLDLHSALVHLLAMPPNANFSGPCGETSAPFSLLWPQPNLRSARSGMGEPNENSRLRPVRHIPKSSLHKCLQLSLTRTHAAVNPCLRQRRCYPKSSLSSLW